MRKYIMFGPKTLGTLTLFVFQINGCPYERQHFGCQAAFENCGIN
jgi:hypothetical protein